MRAPWVRGSERDFTWVAICHSCQSIFHFRRFFLRARVSFRNRFRVGSCGMGSKRVVVLLLRNKTRPRRAFGKRPPTPRKPKGKPGLPFIRRSARWRAKEGRRVGPPWVHIARGPSALGIERTRFTIVFSRVRAPQNAQSWCLGRPPSTCAHDYVLAFLASASKKTRKGRFCV